MSQSASIAQAAFETVQEVASNVLSAAQDASLVAHAVAGLPAPANMTYGRYADGARSTLLAGVTTVDGAIAAVSQAQAAVSAAVATVTAAASNVVSAASMLATAVQAMMEAVRAACSDPADAVRLLSRMAATSDAVPVGSAPIGAAIATTSNAVAGLCTQAALSSLARACADYQPSSADDGTALRTSVTALFDAQIMAAANAGQGGVYQALKALRSAVVTDLNTRAAQLPSLTTITTAAPMPSLALAYKLYGDASRATELTARSGAPASLFLPTSFTGLSS
jgi:prophage DNA circulation protein